MDSISLQQKFEETEGTEDNDEEESQSKCNFIHHCQHPTVINAKHTGNHIPSSFNEAYKIPSWAKAIDREYNALVEIITWYYVTITPEMKPLPDTWDFKIKETVGSVVSELHRARCCIGCNHQVAYRDFHRNEVYAPVARHGKIRIFLVKSTVRSFIVEVADVCNA